MTLPVDPYEPAALMPAGPYRGRAIDASERRALALLPPEEAARYGPRPGEVVAANFRHDGRFFVARFPSGGVSAVVFQKWNFGENGFFYVAHTELRFRLKPESPVILYPQTGPAGSPLSVSEAGRVADLVCSLEAVGVPGSSFNLWGGLRSHFVGVRRFKSTEENYFERVLLERRTIEQWEVDLPEDKKQELFRAVIEDSHARGMSTLYHVFRSSCTTEAFRIIDSVMHYGIRTWRSKVFRRIPHFPEAYLWARRLLKPAGASRMPTLNEEKAAWKAAGPLRDRLSRHRERRREERAAARLSETLREPP